MEERKKLLGTYDIKKRSLMQLGLWVSETDKNFLKLQKPSEGKNTFRYSN